MSKVKPKSTRNPISRERVELPSIPLPTSIGGIDYFTRWQAENYKRALLGAPPLTGEPEKIELITIRALASEMNIHPKTIKRASRGSPPRHRIRQGGVIKKKGHPLRQAARRGDRKFPSSS